MTLRTQSSLLRDKINTRNKMVFAQKTHKGEYWGEKTAHKAKCGPGRQWSATENQALFGQTTDPRALRRNTILISFDSTARPTNQPTTAQEQTVSTARRARRRTNNPANTTLNRHRIRARLHHSTTRAPPHARYRGQGGANTTRRADNRTATTLVEKTLYRGSPPSHRTTLPPSSSPSTRVRHVGRSASPQNQASTDLFKTKHCSSQMPAATCFYSVPSWWTESPPKQKQ